VTTEPIIVFTQELQANVYAATCLFCKTKANNSLLISSLCVEHIPWGAPGITLSVAPFDQLRRKQRRVGDRNNLVIVAVQDDCRHIDLLQIFAPSSPLGYASVFPKLAALMPKEPTRNLVGSFLHSAAAPHR
jgi:hypothetical protein